MERIVNKKYPRVLVFANNSFSKSSANGRTLGNFFAGWPKENLAQFCLMTSGPDFELCDNYYCISDKSALKAFLSLRTPERTIFDDTKLGDDKPLSFKKTPKTPFRMVVRNVVWSLCRWKSTSLLKWVEDFSPEVIVLMSGDSYFILNMARFFAKKHHIPLVLINTEGYYLFNDNYMWKGDMEFLFFPIYKRLYRYYYKKLMHETKYTIYANSLLERDYNTVFKGDNCIIYTGSSIDYKEKRTISNPPIFSYLGNFGFRRYETLVELSEILHSINPIFTLDVYGDASPDVVEVLSKAPYVDYKGLVSYDKVIEIMHQSDILFHVENQAEDLQMSLKYGFSTKIADSISSGTLFCLYASPDIACSRYVQETGSALYAADREELKNKLVDILEDNSARLEIIKRGHKLAVQNHNIERNAEMFRLIIKQIGEL